MHKGFLALVLRPHERDIVAAITHRVLRPIVLCVMFVAVSSSAAFAQPQVRVTRERATIWQRDSTVVVAAVVSKGTVLEVTGRQGDWYIVVVPSGSTAAGTLGLIAVSQVEPVEGSSPLPPRTTERPRARAGAPAPVSHPVEFFGFGDVGYHQWIAKNSFDAIFGSSTTPMFGGGVQFRVTHVFVEVSGERFEKTGQRVFVNNGTVFKLGIADTVRIVPVFLTAGYRQTAGRTTGYGGVGVGRYSYRETSDFSDSDENVDVRFNSYHVVAGFEIATLQWLRPAVEVQYTTVPNALGTSGAAAAFNEHNLGGTQIRLKILVGR